MNIYIHTHAHLHRYFFTVCMHAYIYIYIYITLFSNYTINVRKPGVLLKEQHSSKIS